MAPVSDSVYFPPLEKCLDGGLLLISWRETLVALEGVRGKTHDRLEDLLLEEPVQNILAAPYSPFSPASAQTKSAFDKRTAAINIAPSPDSRYNLEELKADTVWLSKEVTIDEVSALRIVVLELQTRARNNLTSDFSAEEKASLQEAAGNINTETSNLVPQLLLNDVTASGDATPSFDSESSRRRRILQLYLSEKRHILKCSQLLFQASLAPARQSSLDNDESRGDESTLTGRVGRALVEKTAGADTSFDGYLHDSLDALKKLLGGLETGSGWTIEDTEESSIEIDWFHDQIVEIILILEIVLWILDVDKDNMEERNQIVALRNSSIVLTWFQLVAPYNFFDNFDPPYPTVRPLLSSMQSLVATISLALIDPWGTIAYLNVRDLGQETEADEPYILDLAAIAELNTIFIEGASSLSPIASPAVFAWSLVLREIRSTSVSRREAQELKQSQRAIEGIERASSTDGNESSMSLIRRRNSASSEITPGGGIHDRIMEVVMDTDLEDDPIEYMARSSVDGSKVFDVLTTLTTAGPALTALTKIKTRLIILDCVRCTIDPLGYIPEVATTVLAALEGERKFWDVDAREPLDTQPDAVTAFCLDTIMTDCFLTSALARYPYESLPFLKLVRAIAKCQSLQSHDGAGGPVALTWLSNLHTFTYELPNDFKDYETTQEEDNANNILLTKDVQLFESRASRHTFISGDEDAYRFVIPAGTHGRILSDSGPKIALWFHDMSGLQYLAKLMETALSAGECFDATTMQTVERDSLVEIIGTFAALIMASNRQERWQTGKLDAQGPTHHILEEASNGLSRDRDIISVILSLFEEELQRQAEGSEESLELLITCTEFVYALVPVLPGRVWPWLGRSSLLEMNGQGGKLAKIFLGVELIAGRYDFLVACTSLLDALVEDAVANAVVRKSHSKSMVRFGNPEDIGSGVPTRMLSQVLSSFTKAISESFASSCNWRFVDAEQRLTLSQVSATVLDKILSYTYGVDDLAKPTAKLTAALAPAAEHIVNGFLSTDFNQLRFQPFLRALLDGFKTPDSSFQAHGAKLWTQHVNAVLTLATTLTRLSALLGRPSSQLGIQLFKASPLIVRLYGVHESYQMPIVKLLDALVISAASDDAEPPSLLGFLGSQTAKNFLHMISNLGKPLDDDRHAIAIWQLLASVVGNRQQWFSIYLLTGRTPRASLEKKDEASAPIANDKPLLKVALEDLLRIETMSVPRAIAMLKFVSLAQNFWPWAMGDLQPESGFIKAICDYISKIEPVVASAKAERCIEGCHQAQIASLVAEILAMYLYHRRQLGDSKAAEDVLTYISFYTRSAVAAPLYNMSLHSNLKRNFEIRFSGCALQNFKRTGLVEREPGKGYYYNMHVANMMLGSDEGWTGKKNNGLAGELVNANINLSLVDAQVAVLHGWKLLVTELSGTAKPSDSLQRVLAKTIHDCLATNRRSQLPEAIFSRLDQVRADLALTLVQRLVEIQSKTEECLDILRKVWDTISQLDTSFELALSSEDESDITYYRTLLKMLFLSMHFHRGVSEAAPPNAEGPNKETTKMPGNTTALNSGRTQLLVEVINKVVFFGFRDIARAVHELPDVTQPEDIALLTGILQTALSIPGMEFSHNQILTALTTSDVHRVATKLFSWSDKLAIDGDPIYGELSLLFLLELSSVATVAEQLALDGVIGHIACANITTYLRRPNIGSFADGAGLQRCYAIWVRAILPLLLNLLDAVGSSIAAEVAIFLSQFTNLLHNSVEAISPPSSGRAEKKVKYLSYGLVQEISCLSLIAFVLSRFRDGMNGIVEIREMAWDVVEVRESVDWWLGSRAVLRERIVPLGPREVLWAKTKATADSSCQSRLEEVIVNELQSVRDVLNGGEP